MKKTAKPLWVDVKGHLSQFDRAGLLALVQDLYAASKENQAFLHARFNLGDDLLKPYKRTIDRRVCHDVFRDLAAPIFACFMQVPEAVNLMYRCEKLVDWWQRFASRTSMSRTGP